MLCPSCVDICVYVCVGGVVRQVVSTSAPVLAAAILTAGTP